MVSNLKRRTRTIWVTATTSTSWQELMKVYNTSPVDPDRMALIGYSYGGEMAGFVEGKTTRFKAIVSGAPVIDQFSEYGTESGRYQYRWYTGQPWRHFESAWRQSPLAYAEHAKTPFMLLQGQSDTTDPEGQSKEMYRALRQEGVPVQLLLFPREDHGALGGNFAGRPSTEPWAGVIAREHMMKLHLRCIRRQGGTKQAVNRSRLGDLAEISYQHLRMKVR